MKSWLVAALAAAVLPACAARDPAAIESRSEPLVADWRPMPLVNAGLELPPVAGRNCPAQWNCVMHADPSSYRFTVEALDAPEGKQALCIERVRPEPWSTATQGMSAVPLRGARVRVSVAVRIQENSAQGAAAGPWLKVTGGSGQMLEHQERPVTATAGWQRVGVEAAVAGDAFGLELGVTQLGGGRACFDDLRLEVLR
jgi:hypothetical protein